MGSGIALVVAALLYIPYSLQAVPAPTGDSWPGLIYGAIGFGLMVFETLLSLRKKFPVWRIGRGQTWMRGHIWLGLLCYPIVLLHAGFSFGHSLTRVIMWLFTIVIVSGLLGAALQHFVPHIMTVNVPMETIYGQIPRVRGQLIKESDQLISALPLLSETLRMNEVSLTETGSIPASFGLDVTMAEKASLQIRQLYQLKIRPFLETIGKRHVLTSRRTSKGVFDNLRRLAPDDLRPIVDDLENIC